jgi:DHA1 family tetracycline resistance protein-like MFS transporter
VPPSSQGELQGAITSLFSVTAIIAPLIYTNIFSWFTGPAAPVEFGGASYVVAGLFLSGALLVLVTKVRAPQSKTAAMEAAAEN